MESVIERIERGQFWQFHGGIHPPEMKFLTADKPIRPLAIPNELTIPIQQHIGDSGELLVSVGQSVLKGQPLTKCSTPLSVPVHAPTSGTIKAIEKATIAHPSGMQELCIKIAPDGNDQWRERVICPDYKQVEKSVLIEKIADAGIAGMGGAGFPSHVKINTSAQINYLIINAAECEPYITADDLLMREHCSTIVDGINIIDHILNPAFILIGIEDNKPQAIDALKQATQGNDKIKVCVLPTKYPTGGEKQLIKALTGKEVPSGILPSNLGIVMQNVATCYAIAEAIISDTPLIKRVVTVSGQALKKPQNVWALIGTPIEFLLDQCGYPKQQKQHFIMGGPMMGFSLPSTQVPVVKTTNCVLAPSEQEIPDDNQEVECIRCGQCADACPASLLPQELQWQAKAKDQEKLQKLNLFDCIECGACAYVCPSHIPLVHYYRIAKAEIRQQKLLDIKAEKAKQRFEMRKARLEREKIAREEKHKKAAEARRAKMNSGSAEANKEKSAVAAALARVKAKKAQTSSQDENALPAENDQKSQVAAAIARAKAKKQAAQQQTEAPAPDSSKNDRVAAAVAKAKAKKLAAKQSELVQRSDEDAQAAPAADDKKARVAAAVAKAKAKKLATMQSEPAQRSDEEAQVAVPADDRKARVAAAVAKAKAKKQAEKASTLTSESKPQIDKSTPAEQSSQDTDITTANQAKSEPVDDKKARIAAAVAKAKAKKLAQQSTDANNAKEQSE